MVSRYEWKCSVGWSGRRSAGQLWRAGRHSRGRRLERVGKNKGWYLPERAMAPRSEWDRSMEPFDRPDGSVRLAWRRSNGGRLERLRNHESWDLPERAMAPGSERDRSMEFDDRLDRQLWRTRRHPGYWPLEVVQADPRAVPQVGADCNAPLSFPLNFSPLFPG